MNALAVGSLYALIALGYTMVYGILKFINFAHSDVFVLGAWVSYTAALTVGIKNPDHPASIAGWVFMAAYVIASVGLMLVLYERFIQPKLPPHVRRRLPRIQMGVTTIIVGAWALAVIGLVFVARGVHANGSLRMLTGGIILLIAMLTCGLVGFTLERMAYKPLRKAPRLNVLITAIGVSLLLQNVGQAPWMFGTKPEGMPTLLPDIVLNETVMQKGELQGYGTIVELIPNQHSQRLESDGSQRPKWIMRSGVWEAGAGEWTWVDDGSRRPKWIVQLPWGELRAWEDLGVLRLNDDATLETNRSYRLDLPDVHGKRFQVAINMRAGEYPAGKDLAFNGQLGGLLKGGEPYKLVRGPRVPINLVDVVGACTALLLMILLDWLVFRTKLGRAMRAVSHNPVTASLMGIPVDWVISFTFVLGAMLAAAAGFLYPQKYSVINQTAAPTWVLLGLKAFVAAVIGGIGNIRGAMVGGILIGLLEFFVKQYISTSMVNVYVFGLLILVLLFKPSGLFGTAMREKV